MCDFLKKSFLWVTWRSSYYAMLYVWLTGPVWDCPRPGAVPGGLQELKGLPGFPTRESRTHVTGLRCAGVGAVSRTRACHQAFELNFLMVDNSSSSPLFDNIHLPLQKNSVRGVYTALMSLVLYFLPRARRPLSQTCSVRVLLNDFILSVS